MLTKEDKTWITDKLETELDKKLKAELKPVRDDIKELKVDSTLLQQNFQRLEQGMERIESKTDKVLAMVEGLAGKVADLNEENKMGGVTLRRHDVQIHELATATGTTISE